MEYPELSGSPDPDGENVLTPTDQLSFVDMSWSAITAFYHTSRAGIDLLVILGE